MLLLFSNDDDDGAMRIPYNWMAFIDGENLTIRAHALAKKRNLNLAPSEHFERDVFTWFPQHRGWSFEVFKSAEQTSLVYRALRSYYYTSLSGADLRIAKIREQSRS